LDRIELQLLKLGTRSGGFFSLAEASNPKPARRKEIGIERAMS
jgi:hypothetical protein